VEIVNGRRPRACWSLPWHCRFPDAPCSRPARTGLPHRRGRRRRSQQWRRLVCRRQPRRGDRSPPGRQWYTTTRRIMRPRQLRSRAQPFFVGRPSRLHRGLQARRRHHKLTTIPRGRLRLSSLHRRRNSPARKRRLRLLLQPVNRVHVWQSPEGGQAPFVRSSLRAATNLTVGGRQMAPVPSGV
jgi:hypothetical protein